MATVMSSVNAVAVRHLSTAQVRSSLSEPRGRGCNIANVRLDASSARCAAGLTSEQFCFPHTKRLVKSKPFIVTNAATKIKSPAETEWKTKREVLLKAKVRSVGPKEALSLQQEQGYTIIDVRPEADFKLGHPSGAINAQVYRLIKDWTLWDISRRVAFAFFGIFQGTEENPEFLTEVKAVVGKNDNVIVACIAGGTMKPTPNMAEGSQSRSLIAAYLLTLDGFTNVVHMEGGLKQWFKLGLPTDEIVED